MLIASDKKRVLTEQRDELEPGNHPAFSAIGTHHILLHQPDVPSNPSSLRQAGVSPRSLRKCILTN